MGRIISNIRKINPPRQFLKGEDGWYRMIDYVGNDIIVSEVKWTSYGCVIKDYRNKYIVILKNGKVADIEGVEKLDTITDKNLADRLSDIQSRVSDLQGDCGVNT